MKILPIQDTKADLSEMSKAGGTTCPVKGEMSKPQPELTSHDLLLSDDFFRGEMNIPPRRRLKMRPPLKF